MIFPDGKWQHKLFDLNIKHYKSTELVSFYTLDIGLK